jgi:hypothetical protein
MQKKNALQPTSVLVAQLGKSSKKVLFYLK